MIAFARFRSVSCKKITVVARGEYFEFKNGTENNVGKLLFY